MIEFAILLPVFALLIAGIVLLGTFILQIHVATDGTRKAARAVAALSNTPSSCTYLEQKGVQEAQEFLAEFSQQSSLGGIVTRWGVPTAEISNASWDGYVYQVIHVEFRSQDTDCGLCFMGINPMHNIPTSSTFMLEGKCT